MLYLIGSLPIDVAPFNTHEVSFQAGADFAEKPIVGAEPGLEFVGESGATWTLAGRIFPEAIGGVTELSVLHQMRASGQPQYMVRGDGTPLGWVVITQVQERATFLDARGVGRQIDLTITVRRTQKPFAGSFFSLIAGLLR